MESTVFTDRAGNEYTITPFCHARVLDATRYLRKEKGLVVSADDTGFEKSIEFQVALANALLTKLVLVSPERRDLSPAARATFIAESTGAASWIIAKAGELGEKAAALYKDEEKNS